MASDEAERLAALIERLQRHARIIRACRELQDGMHEPDPEDLDAAIAALLRMPAAPALDAIQIDPERCGGIPCVGGMRVTVARVVAELAEGHSLSTLQADFGWDDGSVQAALRALATMLDRTPAAPPPAPEKKQEIRRQTAIMDAVAAAAPFPEAP